jgi:hypothetical protein
MSAVAGRPPLVVAHPRRPPLSTSLSGTELVVLARQLGVSAAGGKAKLTARWQLSTGSQCRRLRVGHECRVRG